MKVAYVGNFRRPWCTEVHVALSLTALGHEVLRCQEDEVDWTKLVERVEGCEVLLWTRTWSTPAAEATAALAALRARGVPSAAFHLDRWWGLEREYQIASEPFFQAVDVVFTADGGHAAQWEGAGVDHVWLPPAVYDGDVTRSARRTRTEPVIFVGSHPYPHESWRGYRRELIDTLAQRYGQAFGLYPRAGRQLRGPQLNSLYRSTAIVVGDSCLSGGATHYWSDRIPETLGRGALLIHPEVDGLADWYPQLPTYPIGDFDALCDTVDWWLARPAERTARACELRELVLDRDTYACRMETLLDVLFARRDRIGSRFEQNGRRAHFEPRPIDIGGDDFVVAVEVWQRNDYRVPEEGFTGTVLDVGANVGVFSVLAAKAGAEHVVAVEPEPDNLERLAHHLKLNGVEDRVTVLPMALSNGDEPIVGVRGFGGSASTTRDSDDPSIVDFVATVTLGQLVEQFGPFEMVKMDIEGGEWDVLDDIDGTVLGRIGRLSMEWHAPGMAPYFSHLTDVPARFGRLVALLAEHGTVETIGRPNVGGLLHWRRY